MTRVEYVEYSLAAQWVLPWSAVGRRAWSFLPFYCTEQPDACHLRDALAMLAIVGRESRVDRPDCLPRRV